MNIDRAIEILNNISEEDFITGKFTNGRDKCCSIGHLARMSSNNKDDYSEKICHAGSNKHMVEFVLYLMRLFPYRKSIYDINDKAVIRYPQKTSKERVLAYLNDCKRQSIIIA